jgi:hypothetical protein
MTTTPIEILNNSKEMGRRETRRGVWGNNSSGR